MKISVYEFLKVLKIIIMNIKVFSVLVDNIYLYYFRFLKVKEDLYIIYNNLFTKIIYKFDGKFNNYDDFDLILKVKEVYNILNNFKNYEFLKFNIKKVCFEVDEDIVFPIFMNKNICLEVREEIFGIENLEIDNDIEIVDIDFKEMKEIKILKNIMELRNSKYENNYFFDSENYYFSFFNIFVKRKINFLKLKNIDLLNYKLICKLINICKIKSICFKDNIIWMDRIKYIINNDNVDIKEKKELFELFVNEKVEKEIELKLEFINFLSCVVNADKTASIIFDNGVIYAQSSKEDDIDYLFNTQNDDKYFFVVNALSLYKILRVLYLVNSNLNKIIIRVKEFYGRKCLIIVSDEVEIATEILSVENEDEVNENEDIDINIE